jgi:hypothetical protein
MADSDDRAGTVRRLFKQITEAWSDLITDPHDFVGVDDEWILFTNRGCGPLGVTPSLQRGTM